MSIDHAPWDLNSLPVNFLFNVTFVGERKRKKLRKCQSTNKGIGMIMMIRGEGEAWRIAEKEIGKIL